jgi:hypothetical protein
VKAHRLSVVAVVLTAVALTLSGCGFLEPVPTSSPSTSPSPTVLDTSKYIGGVIDPADTTWTGKDSGGDQTRITLHADGTAAISYGSNSYDYAGDTWRVTDGVLHLEVYLDEENGEAEYVGVWDADTSTLETTLITTRTAKKLDVTLTQK